ncbi:hypothetical protein BCR33DRAFT_771986 [Rhizoclosmatium globosum]|uniref:Uncharacterized protein n=1 Tax=Rhizoclosmatium globosum TaxID=329046 RepID=A0A1Y2B9I4_9FUNG|nr:hypothetical protein BCR33DRAFT_771986 [Rhizoclosmatium globosum]|eukprot:ORY31160.1 hypothetical protein BCR33DRAFT_771986 [Rhizoclosmatium globosum]
MNSVRFSERNPIIQCGTSKSPQRPGSCAVRSSLKKCNERKEDVAMTTLLAKIATQASTNSRKPSLESSLYSTGQENKRKKETQEIYTPCKIIYSNNDDSDVDDGAELFFHRDSHASRYAVPRQNPYPPNSNVIHQVKDETSNPNDPLFASVFPRHQRDTNPNSKFRDSFSSRNTVSTGPNLLDMSPSLDEKFGPVDEYPKPVLYGDYIRYENWTQSTKILQQDETDPMTEAKIKKLCKKQLPPEPDQEPEEFIENAAIALHNLIKPLLNSISMPLLAQQYGEAQEEANSTSNTSNQTSPFDFTMKIDVCSADDNVATQAPTISSRSRSPSFLHSQSLSSRCPSFVMTKSPSQISMSSIPSTRKPSLISTSTNAPPAPEPPKPPPPYRALIHSAKDRKSIKVRQPPTPEPPPINVEVYIQKARGTIGRGASWKDKKMRVTDVGAWILLAAKEKASLTSLHGLEPVTSEANITSGLTPPIRPTTPMKSASFSGLPATAEPESKPIAAVSPKTITRASFSFSDSKRETSVKPHTSTIDSTRTTISCVGRIEQEPQSRQTSPDGSSGSVAHGLESSPERTVSASKPKNTFNRMDKVKAKADYSRVVVNECIRKHVEVNFNDIGR